MAIDIGVPESLERNGQVCILRAVSAALDKRVQPLELFFDLVFVFALTQVTARMADDLSWAGLGRGLLILAAIWWAWAAYAWLTNEVDSRRRSVRLTMFGSMAGMLVASLAIPGAFEGSAVVFGCGYLVVRVLHIALFAAGSDDVDVRRATSALAPTAITAPALLLVAAALEGTAQTLLWVVALGIDYVGAAVRGIDGWRLSPAHFAERHALIVLIALGESIVAIGVGAGDTALDTGVIAAAVLGIAAAAALWWTHFDELDEGAVERRLRHLSRRVRNVTARDSFSFLHLPIVAGIVLLALGIKKTLGDVDGTLAPVAAAALCGGVALYLTADAAFRARCLQRLHRARFVAAAGCLAWLPLAMQLPALAALGGIATGCAAFVAYESHVSRPTPTVVPEAARTN
jgi:low temperature requirement protein LtrA